MDFVSRYTSHTPDKHGKVCYSAEEHRIWQILYERQYALLQGRACQPYLDGFQQLGLTAAGIPQIPDLNQRLQTLTGWSVAPVAALITAREFFELLASRQFPAATFIRCEDELNYVKEPDIFHELFGHCPLLTNSVYADFMQNYAVRVLQSPEADWILLQRLFWFTVEFGLIRDQQGLRAYGGGILSSIEETVYCVESDIPMRVLFDPVVAFRTPYRIDMLQPIYFVIDSFEQLYSFIQTDIRESIQRARSLGELPPVFSVDSDNPSIHIHAC